MNWLEYLKIEELPEQYQAVARVLGLEGTLKLAEAFPGVPLYFKSVDKLLRPAKRAYILARRASASPEQPFNARTLALETGLPLATVYEMLAEAKEESKQESFTFED